jgi:hypothetical protein
MNSTVNIGNIYVIRDKTIFYVQGVDKIMETLKNLGTGFVFWLQ